MSDFLSNLFDWAGEFDDMVAEARKAGKNTISINVPKDPSSKKMNLLVVQKQGHVITNPKSKKTWKIKIDANNNELRDIRMTTVSLK